MMNPRGLAALACFCAVSTTAIASNLVQVDREGTIAVRVEVDYGLLDSCEAREIPHIIEHVILSETTFGETPADLISELSKQGVRFSAVTRQDFTEYAFEGRPGTGHLIYQAVMETLGRTDFPLMSIPREIEAIRLELGREPGFTSRPHQFEAWAFAHVPGAPPPCEYSELPVEQLSHAKILDAFTRHYGATAYQISVVAPAGEFDGEALEKDLIAVRPSAQVPARKGGTDTADMPALEQSAASASQYSTLEVLAGIPGRRVLPPAKAREMAERARLALQASLRKAPLAYTVKSVVHQSNTAGWISLTADLPTSMHVSLAEDIRELVSSSFRESLSQPVDLAPLSNREMAENIHLEAFEHGHRWPGVSQIGIQVRVSASAHNGVWVSRLVTFAGGAIIICSILTTLLAYLGWRKRESSKIRANG